MLQKAKLAGELFDGQQARRPDDRTEARPIPALLDRAEINRAQHVVGTAAEIAEPFAAGSTDTAGGNAIPQQASRAWAEQLATVLGSAATRDCRKIALCPLSGVSSAAETAAAVAQWIADAGGGATVIVEANYARPTLSRIFNLRRFGLGEAAVSTDQVERFIQDTHRPDIKIMSSGRRPGRSDRQAWGAGVGHVVDSLAAMFDQVVIEIPSPSQPEFAWLPLRDADQALIGVLQPSRSERAKGQRMRMELEKADLCLAGVMLAQRFSMSDAVRMERLARQFDRSASARDEASVTSRRGG